MPTGLAWYVIATFFFSVSYFEHHHRSIKRRTVNILNASSGATAGTVQ